MEAVLRFTARRAAPIARPASVVTSSCASRECNQLLAFCVFVRRSARRVMQRKWTGRGAARSRPSGGAMQQSLADEKQTSTYTMAPQRRINDDATHRGQRQVHEKGSQTRLRRSQTKMGVKARSRSIPAARALSNLCRSNGSCNSCTPKESNARSGCTKGRCRRRKHRCRCASSSSSSCMACGDSWCIASTGARNNMCKRLWSGSHACALPPGAHHTATADPPTTREQRGFSRLASTEQATLSRVQPSQVHRQSDRAVRGPTIEMVSRKCQVVPQRQGCNR